MKKYISFLFFFASLFLAGCEEQQASTENMQKNTQDLPLVTVIAPWEINSLDPNQSGIIFQRMNLAETLVETDTHGKLTAGLAKTWQSNESATSWIFTLQEATFHNGKPVTAQAVEKSLNIAMKKPGVLQNAFIKEIKALNPTQIQFELTQPFVPFPAFLTHYSTLILAEESFNPAGDVIQLIGSGAFKPIQISPPQKIEATRFEQYWGKKATLSQANYLASSRSETRVLMAQSDESSLVFNLDTPSSERLKNDPNIRLTQGSIARTIQLKMDVAKPFFKDIAIRQALSQAIDRKAISELVFKMDNGVADQILPNAFSEWRVASSATPVSIEQIKQNLITAGYQFNAEGKLQDQQHNTFHFTLRTFSDRPELPIIATILQERWKKIGVEVNVSIGNFSEIPAGHQDGSLEMALYALNYGKMVDPLGVILQDYANGGSDWGVMNWHNSQLDQALKQIEAEQDSQKILKLKQQVSQIIYDEKPIIPVIYYQQNVASHHHIKGVELDPFERRFFLEKLSQ